MATGPPYQYPPNYATGPSGAYVAPPLTLEINMNYFATPSIGPTGDYLPSSLSNVYDNLKSNEYIIRGNQTVPNDFSAFVWNSGANNFCNYYNAYNIVPGIWLANDATGFTWRIDEIYNVTDAKDLSGNNTGAGVFWAKMTDVDNYNASIDNTGSFSGAPIQPQSLTIAFQLSENGFPIFSPQDTFQLNPSFSGNVIGRFQALNTYEEYVSIGQTGAAATFQVGDPVWINPATNLFEPSRNLSNASTIFQTIGIVTSVAVAGNSNAFTFQPFTEYRNDLGLTGPPGTIYYISPTGTSQFTSNKPESNAYPMYQIIDNDGDAVLLNNGFGVGPGGGGATGATGPTGPTGPTGTIYSGIVFDGGNSLSTYPVGPVFDCGNSAP